MNYFLFTDGENVYPEKEVNSLVRNLKEKKEIWTDIAGGPKLKLFLFRIEEDLKGSTLQIIHE